VNFKSFYLTESEDFPERTIDNYVGKFGDDKKLMTFDKIFSKITIFEVTDKKIVYGTEANKIKVDIESGEDKQEQLEWETKLYNKEIKNYNEMLKHYYDNIFEKKFINEVDDFRKTLNSKMKSIVGMYILLRELNK